MKYIRTVEELMKRLENIDSYKTIKFNRQDEDSIEVCMGSVENCFTYTIRFKKSYYKDYYIDVLLNSSNPNITAICHTDFPTINRVVEQVKNYLDNSKWLGESED